MKKTYVTPKLLIEEYCLTDSIAGACTDVGDESVLNKQAVTISKIDCWDTKKNQLKNCSESHEVSFSPITIFADGSENLNGCTRDIYDNDQYLALLKELGGNTSSANWTEVDQGDYKYYTWKGSSETHTVGFANIIPGTLFKS